MKHIIEGILERYGIPWYNGTTIDPEAFKNCDGKTVPVIDILGSSYGNYQLGEAKLLWSKDQINYIAEIDASDSLIDNFKMHGWGLSLFANRIVKKETTVVYGEIRYMFPAQRCDASVRILKIDGEDIPNDKRTKKQLEKRLKEVRRKISDIKDRIKNDKGELSDFEREEMFIQSRLTNLEKE